MEFTLKMNKQIKRFHSCGIFNQIIGIIKQDDSFLTDKILLPLIMFVILNAFEDKKSETSLINNHFEWIRELCYLKNILGDNTIKISNKEQRMVLFINQKNTQIITILNNCECLNYSYKTVFVE